ncbi:MAG: FAD-dependent oxidoreductase, partial [Cyanobacteria bacterium J06628_3]
ERQKLLTVGIIGAGPVGVELAATLADLLPVWYEALQGNTEELQIAIIQRGKEILSGDTNEKLRPVSKTSLQQRTASVKLILNANVSAVGKDWVRYERIENTENLEAATIAWTAGSVTHPLIRQLAVSEKYRTSKGKLVVDDTCRLPEYPEVFAGGDCATTIENPQPALAQVAYQQAETIATNIQALCEGKEISPAKVSLRGTLLKTGMGESVAEIYDLFEVKGKAGHLIRQATYLEMLPTPLRNFKATAQWLTESIFQKFVDS